MGYHGKFFTKNKYWELDFKKFDDYWLWFEFHLSISRKTDHAGLRFRFEIIGLGIEIDIYDHRHWDHEKDSWVEGV